MGGVSWLDKHDRALMSEELGTWVAGFLCSSPFILLFSWWVYKELEADKERRERKAWLAKNPLVKCRHCGHLVANSDDNWITCPKCGGKN